MGTIMFLIGWLVMWPKQNVVIASATQVAEGGQPIREAKACGRRVVLVSSGTQGATKKPLDPVSGALCLGFTLTAILYSLFLILL